MDSVSQLKTALGGRYEIDREIGRGGMATVYLARDVRHNRKVALKVLNPELGAVLGVERFLAEIQVTANLQHPNLLPLFDSGEADGLLFYVMPYVEGESLRTRLNREKQLPIDEAIHVTAAACNALDHAHRHGVIHRDLKPENILLHEGQPLIADFGIALAVSVAGGGRVTQTGISLGTPQYMSPEQATGDRPVDGRSDIYSLGCVIYEMLTGEPPHIGNTVQSIIAKVLTDKPQSVRLLRDTIPEHVDLAIQKALAKLPADRWSSAHAFADALHGRAATLATASRPREGGARARLRDPVVVGLALITLLSIAGAVSTRWNRGRNAAALPARFQLSFPPDIQIDNVYAPLTITPDGRYVVFRASSGGTSQLARRAVNELATKIIPGTENAGWPFPSPDGKWIGFVSGDYLKKVPIEGGPSVTITRIGAVVNGASWGPGNVIVLGSYAGSTALTVVSASGGAPRPLTKLASAAGELQQRWPCILGDGNTILYTSWARDGLVGAHIAVASLETGETRILDLIGTRPIGVIEGHLVYVRPDGALMAAPFDLRRRTVTGEPIALVDGLNINVPSGAARVALGGSTLVYLSGGGATRLSIADTAGVSRTLATEPGGYYYPTWSPDGRRIALSGSLVGGLNVSTGDVWVLELSSNALTRLTSEASNTYPMWTRDGRRLVFVSNRGDGRNRVWQQFADASAPAEKLFETDDDVGEALLAPDGHTLVYRTAGFGVSQQRDIYYVDLTGDRKPKPIVVSRFQESEPRLSPDGKWLAYESDETGTMQVYVRPFPGPGGVTQVSPDGGIEPVWAHRGRRLFYRHGRELVAATITPGAQFGVSQRRVLFEGAFFTQYLAHPSYDVAPDDKHFVISRLDESGQIIVVTNWLNELRARTVR